MHDGSRKTTAQDGQWVMVIIAWTLVGIPLAWGVYRTFLGALKLFH
jgi:hypothetical protein